MAKVSALPASPSQGRSEKALPAAEPTEEDVKAMVAARQLNCGIPRAGPLPLQWNSSCARDVRVRGSWDGWARDYALEQLAQLATAKQNS